MLGIREDDKGMSREEEEEGGLGWGGLWVWVCWGGWEMHRGGIKESSSDWGGGGGDQAEWNFPSILLGISVEEQVCVEQGFSLVYVHDFWTLGSDTSQLYKDLTGFVNSQLNYPVYGCIWLEEQSVLVKKKKKHHDCIW